MLAVCNPMFHTQAGLLNPKLISAAGGRVAEVSQHIPASL